jgi:hypothetical protein
VGVALQATFLKLSTCWCSISIKCLNLPPSLAGPFSFPAHSGRTFSKVRALSPSASCSKPSAVTIPTLPILRYMMVSSDLFCSWRPDPGRGSGKRVLERTPGWPRGRRGGNRRLLLVERAARKGCLLNQTGRPERKTSPSKDPLTWKRNFRFQCSKPESERVCYGADYESIECSSSLSR